MVASTAPPWWGGMPTRRGGGLGTAISYHRARSSPGRGGGALAPAQMSRMRERASHSTKEKWGVAIQTMTT